jgi:prepilin-type processing-associated H-X9-DG protein
MTAYSNVATDKQSNFIISLARYTSSKDIWACPSVTLRPGVPGKNGYWVSGDYPLDTTQYKNVGYGFNEVMVSIGGDPTMRRKGPAALKDLRNPAGIAIIGDGNSMYASYQTWVRNGQFIENGTISPTNVPAPGELYWSWSSPNQTSANPWAYGQTRHMGGSTFVYADGHAAYSKPSVLNPTYNDSGNAYKYGYYPKAALY